MEIPKSISHINLTKMKPANMGITFYLNLVRKYDWNKEEMEELTYITEAFVVIMNHEEMIELLKDYGVEL